ncbi:hypothetical protein CMI42_05440 [Candidatus Pacearchaeota archaeon]|nr:hypothetical protein [Candidatus Pacearchaeota archaeon]|tara:strand:+ start:994 stop:1413 length:420 start_codon:yes stop_codon:yes gene_type:complete
MRIIGFNLTKILVEKKDEQPKGIKVNQKIDIRDLKKEEIPITKSEIIKLNFKLTFDYSDNYAKIEFEGNVLILPDRDEMKKFLDSWKSKQLPEGSRIPLFNFIMDKCNIKALVFEDDMGLPLHLPMPRASINPNQNKSG